jgi:poly(3-hydroxybutyrate) depolymerase
LGNSDYPAISTVLTYWANHNGANSTPVTTSLTSGVTSVEKSVYSDSSGTGWVEHYKVNAGGHDWFNLDLSGSDTNQLIWNFFSQHGLDGPL